jgi:hypothetical protein
MNKKLSILSIEYVYERAAAQVLLALICLAIIAYLYFVGASVLNIIARKEAAQKTTALQGSVAQLEKQYFTLSSAVTPDTASALGLAPITNAQFVYRPGATAIASHAADTMNRDAI